MDISTLISNVGFPIACCIYMMYTHKIEMDTMAKAIENNTEAIKELRLEIREGKHNGNESN